VACRPAILTSATHLAGDDAVRIGVIAPSCPLDRDVAARLTALVGNRAELVIDPQCFLSNGHFAGPDDARRDALIAMANDPAIDAIWFARGGYGACRIAESTIKALGPEARGKRYLGYSDAGFLLAGLYARGIGHVAHGPMPADLARQGGEAAIGRALDWLIDGRAHDEQDAQTGVGLSPPLTGARTRHAAFNLTVFSQLLGTTLQPNLTDHVLMLEEVSEHLYAIDRHFFHITSNPAIRGVAGIKLGRCTDIPDNDRPFGSDAESIAQDWCARSGIAWLGRADIGHDADNKVIAFG
jgi:muramoyltetrapeptide carboxypeptidase